MSAVMLETVLIIGLFMVLLWTGYCYVRLKANLEGRARAIFQDWRERELASITEHLNTQAGERIRREVDLQSRDWRMQEGERIRRDAIRRSREVIHGKVTEHLIPYFPAFSWNPSDARFLGSPIDFVVFDGLSENDVKEIIFIEVKSGNRKVLSSRERSVARCVESGKVSFQILHPDDC